MSTVELPERWYTLKEASEKLREDYGLLVSWHTLRKLVDGSDPAPSALNFGKRQVRMTELIPWLKQKGIIER